MATPPTVWLDQVLAVPLLGLRWAPSQFFSEHEFIEAVRPVLDSFPASETFNLKQLAPMAHQIDCAGYTFIVTQSDVTVGFTYPAAIKIGSNSLPLVDIGQPVRSYSAVLADVLERAKPFVSSLPFIKRAKLSRIGVVANCRMNAGEPPPGVRRFLDHLGAPWKVTPDEGKVQVRATLAKQDKWTDCCHHHVAFGALSPAGSIDLTLDWQRYFEPPQAGESYSKNLEDCARAAVEYFQRFGTGELAYVKRATD